MTTRQPKSRFLSFFGTAIRVGLIGWLVMPVVQAVADEPAGPLELAVKGGTAVNLFTPLDDPAAKRAVERWKAFFEARGCTVTVVPPAADPKLPTAGAVLAFETEDNCPVAKSAKVDIAALKDARPESHVIAVTSLAGRPVVAVVGKTAAGADCGSARLLSKVVCWDGKVAATQPGVEVNKPFFNGREATLGLKMTDGVSLIQWAPERLARYIGMVQACGFNSVQLCDVNGYWLNPKLEHKTTKPVFRLLAETAHKNGMSVTQFVWGGALSKTEAEKFAKAYADVVDHLITHWGDPGPGGYVKPQQLTVMLLDTYRKINPKVRATISTWYNQKFWDGDPAAKSFLDETFMPKEIGIALHRWWDDETWHADGKNPERAERVLAAGRRLGIWSHYLMDFETQPGDHLRNRVLQTYFSSLPPEVSNKADWLSDTKNTHGSPSRICLFVCGQKMWNPYRPLRDIMMDYCRSMYGPAYAATMCDAFECAEATGPQFDSFAYVPNARVLRLKRDIFPEVWKDAAYAARVDRVLAELDKVKLPEDWKPNLPDVGSVTDDVKALRDRLLAAKERFAKTLPKK